MRDKRYFLADFHIHSQYSRATSSQMYPTQLDAFARSKGIKVLGTGDFLHPEYLKSLKNDLIPAEDGLYVCSEDPESTRFILTTEVSNIYSQGGRVRKIHNLILAPSLEVASELQKIFLKHGNLQADGRPIFGMSSKMLVKIVMEVDRDCMVIPAHIWTPWFSLFGSRSGFDSIEECFEEELCHIHCLETGLSSDPPMNWMVSGLDRFILISNSDSHSPQRIGRECNIFSCDLSYSAIIRALRGETEGFEGTVEFYPEEGKYHYDGHRVCNVCLHPKESMGFNNLCPVCGQELTIGVLHRVHELADREWGYRPPNAKPFYYIVPLSEIIACAFETTSTSARVIKEYNRIIGEYGPELDLLLWEDLSQLNGHVDERIIRYIDMMRAGKVYITPGFDGEYGKVTFVEKEIREETVFSPNIANKNKKAKQKSLL